MRNYYITVIPNYPDNDKHLECHIPLPFQIRKGEDGYYYFDKKKVEHKYNIFKSENKVDDRWICHIDGDTLGANESLEKIFHIIISKDLDKIVDYCFDVYEKSLKMELKRIAKAKKELNSGLTVV